MKRIETTSIYGRICLIRNGGLGFQALLDHVIIEFRPLASAVPENKDRHHACSELKLSVVFSLGGKV